MNGLELKHNKIAVIGFGVSGKSIAQYFLKQNVRVDIFEDKKQSDFDFELVHLFTSNDACRIFFSDSEQSKNFSEYDMIVASPGVPRSHKIVVAALELGIECVTDITVFLRLYKAQFPKGKVISVTGSNGKSTTVSLLYDVLQSAGCDAYLGGNIGISPLDFLNQIKTQQPLVILETSSYQLEYLAPTDYFDIACILNLSDNHLNRYDGKKELYAKAKLGGIDAKKTTVLLNFDDQYTRQYIMSQIKADKVLGIQFETVNPYDVITFENDSILYKGEEDALYIEKISQSKLPGIHNVYNIAFVCGVMYLLDIASNETIQSTIKNFAGLKHRVQYVGTFNEVTYINDSKSTSPDATVKALETIGIDDKNIILISGGNDKDISYESMKEGYTKFVKSLILLPGSANIKLKTLAQVTDVELIAEVQTMQEAFDGIQSYVKEGNVVLLSPATDSHASFMSFEDRGNQFIQCVQNLKK